jgi:hypothetical protein
MPIATDAPGVILHSLPIRQPLLWVARPKPVFQPASPT